MPRSSHHATTEVIRFFILSLTIVTISTVAAAAGFGTINARERAEYIRRAQVWMPTDISHMDILRGPEGPHSYAFNEIVNCTYIPRKAGGTTSKFHCRSSEGKKLKVRYDPANGKVYAMPTATRLFWALGFGAIRSFPVRVACRSCPEDPFMDPNGDVANRLFDPATVEKKLPGAVIHLQGADKDYGWKWNELDQVDEKSGGASRAQIDALKLLAAFVQHGDNNETQQRLICLPGGIQDDGQGHRTCTRPFLYVKDLGSTFGGAEKLNEQASMNLIAWAAHPIWKDRSHCIADLAHTPSGTLTNPRISEAGRAFLANLLSQLSDRQIGDLFRVGRADRRDQSEADLTALSQSPQYAPIPDWVREFKIKRDQILRTHCPK